MFTCCRYAAHLLWVYDQGGPVTYPKDRFYLAVGMQARACEELPGGTPGYPPAKTTQSNALRLQKQLVSRFHFVPESFGFPELVFSDILQIPGQTL